MDTATIDRAAAFLLAHRKAPQQAVVDDLPEDMRPASLDEGYAIAQRLAALFADDPAFGPAGAWKIGCTTVALQKLMGVPHPCCGQLYEQRIHRDSATVSLSAHHFMRLECEIAVRLGRDLPLPSAPHDAQTVAGAVAAILPSVEIIDNRYADPTKASTGGLIADDFLGAGLILGAEVPAGQIDDPAALEGGFSIDGADPAETGKGADILGHPYAALAWLANHRNAQGGMLKAGEIVTLGALVPPYRPEPGQVIETRITGLQPVRVTVTA